MYITVATPPFDSIETFDEVTTSLGSEPDGLHARYAGIADGKVRVVALWESKEHADRFLTDQLGPALAKALGPEPAGLPEYIGIDVERTFAGEPVR